MYLSV